MPDRPVDRTVDRAVVLIAYLSFVVLGMPTAMLGVIWSPHMRASFGLGLDAVGALYITYSSGYFVASVISGRLFARLPIGALFAAGCALSALCFAGYALAPVWALIVALGLAAGFGAGLLDSGMNIYFAAHFDARLMNWLHAAFGVGSTLAPLIIGAVLLRGGQWTSGYWLAAALFLLMALAFGATRARWLPIVGGDGAAADAQATGGATLRLPVVWAGICIFALFAGLESSTGQWSKSVFFESRGVAEAVASNWVALYWLSFTIGRIALGVVVRRFRAERLLKLCLLGSLAGMALFAWNPFPLSGVLGLCVFGFTFGPLFAMLVTATYERLGARHAANAIGFQVAAAMVGNGILPGALGLLGVAAGIESIPPALLAAVALMAALYAVWRRLPVRQV